MAKPAGRLGWHGWRRVLKRTGAAAGTDRLTLAAAGCAFYATLALFPAISMLVSLYGLVFDPNSVEPQLASLQLLLPPAAFELIADRVQLLVSKPSGTLTFGLLVSFGLALWSASSGTKAILGALNLATEQAEVRGFWRFQATALGLTLGLALAGSAGLGVLLLLPWGTAQLGLSAYAAGIARVSGVLALLVSFQLLLDLLYRFGPSRQRASWGWLSVGSVTATLCWLTVSIGFSAYVQRLASYDATYGSLGAVVGVMMWFYFSALFVLLGAELNAEVAAERAIPPS